MVEIARPGQSRELVLPSDVDPEFFKNRPEDVNWKLRVQMADGSIQSFIGCDWEAVSRFGRVVSATVVDKEGNPLFDRPRYEEAPNVNIVAWGVDGQTGKIKVALISQPRPHADDPTNPNNTDTLVFAQIPMGFKDRVLGKDQLENFESSRDAATRETGEETGATVIRDIFEPQFPYHNPNPTFVGTWSDLVIVEVDLDKIEQLRADRSEPIFKAEYITLKELAVEIRTGKTERGISRMCTSNSALLIFLFNLKNLLERSRGNRPLDLREADLLTEDSINIINHEEKKRIQENRREFRDEVGELKVTYRRTKMARSMHFHRFDHEGREIQPFLDLPALVDYLGLTPQHLMRIYKLMEEGDPNKSLIENLRGFNADGKNYLRRLLGKPIEFAMRENLYNASIGLKDDIRRIFDFGWMGDISKKAA